MWSIDPMKALNIVKLIHMSETTPADVLHLMSEHILMDWAILLRGSYAQWEISMMWWYLEHVMAAQQPDGVFLLHPALQFPLAFNVKSPQWCNLPSPETKAWLTVRKGCADPVNSLNSSTLKCNQTERSNINFIATASDALQEFAKSG